MKSAIVGGDIQSRMANTGMTGTGKNGTWGWARSVPKSVNQVSLANPWGRPMLPTASQKLLLDNGLAGVLIFACEISALLSINCFNS